MRNGRKIIKFCLFCSCAEDLGGDVEHHPMLAHFYNGSYEVRDVLRELIANKSLTKIQTNR